jgi:hypothetical protein
MNQPEPYTYTDTDQDTLKIWGTHVLWFPQGSVSVVVTEGGKRSAVYITPDRVDEVVAAIYTAAGRKPPRLDFLQECDTCGAGYTLGQPCQTCAFNARMAAEQATRSL